MEGQSSPDIQPIILLPRTPGTPEDGAEFEATWVTACDKCGIEATPLTVKEARALEPNLADNIVSVYRVPDSAVDGFRLVWHPDVAR